MGVACRPPSRGRVPGLRPEEGGDLSGAPPGRATPVAAVPGPPPGHRASLRSRSADHPPRAGERSRGGARRSNAERAGAPDRSEEHTSELQSHLNLVCRLLLEKKKKKLLTSTQSKLHIQNTEL